MRIIFINANLGSGGAEKMLAWLANCMVKDNEVTFLTYRDVNNALDFFELNNKINRIRLCTETTDTGFFPSLNTINEIHKLLKINQYDIAVAFLSPSQLRLSVARIGTKTRILFSQRGDPYQHASKGIKQIISHLAFNLADFYVFQTERAKEYYSNRIQNRSTVIENPIKPLRRTVERTNENIEKKIVTVSRLNIHQKRQDLLIEAFKRFHAVHTEYELHLYGDGPDRNELQKLASDNENIIFDGEVSNVAEVIQNAAMFILTSDYEGIPNALLEAMSLGVPCISTDCSPGGAAVLIQDGENGVLVNCGDIDGLYRKMLEFVSDRDKAEIMGNKARYVCTAFSTETIENKWHDVITNM